MGTTDSKVNHQHKIQHQTFENAKFLDHDELQIQVRTTLDDYNTWKNNLKKISFINKQNILFPLNHSFQEEGWCSQNTGFAKITYDNYPFVFQQELENRISLSKHLSEEQMWYLLFTLVTTAKDFSLLNKKVGDIRPHNIFVNSAGQIKLAVCFSWPNQPSNLQKTMNEKQVTYISPQQLEICKQNKIQSLVDGILAQSFSIGLTMLHAGLLENLASIYNLEVFQINRKLLDQKIQTWMDLQFLDENNQKLTYSPSLKNIVKNLCNFDQNQRQKSTQIFALLQPHKQAILNIEPFQLKYKTQNLPKNYKQHESHLPLSQRISYIQQKNINFPVYNYHQIQRVYPSNQTPVSINPNYDWSTRTFTQVPANRIPNYNLQLFDRYANSAKSPQKNSNLNVYLPNTVISQGNSFQTKPAYNELNSSIKKATTIVKPFLSIDQQNPNKIYRNENHMTLEKQVQKRVQSNDFIQISHIYHQKQAYPTSNFTIPVVSTDLNSDFLKKIDEQIKKSKMMFPS